MRWIDAERLYVCMEGCGWACDAPEEPKMSKGKKNRWQRAAGVEGIDTDVIVKILKTRAVQLADDYYHTLSKFSPAKKVYGRGAVQSWCVHCNAGVLVLPRGTIAATNGARGSTPNPVMLGEAVFEYCDQAGGGT